MLGPAPFAISYSEVVGKVSAERERQHHFPSGLISIKQEPFSGHFAKQGILKQTDKSCIAPSKQTTSGALFPPDSRPESPKRPATVTTSRPWARPPPRESERSSTLKLSPSDLSETVVTTSNSLSPPSQHSSTVSVSSSSSPVFNRSNKMNAFPDHHHTHRPTSFYIEDILLPKPKQLQYARAELTAAAAAAAAAGAAAGAAAMGGPLGGRHGGLPEYYTYLPGPTYLPQQHFAHPAFAAHKHEHPFLLPAGAGKTIFLKFIIQNMRMNNAQNRRKLKLSNSGLTIIARQNNI